MVVQYKCPSCGADMRYDAETGKLKCGSCGKLMALYYAKNEGRGREEDSEEK